MIISDELLEEFKSRMHISHQSEDESLKNILSASWTDLQAKCGEFDPTQNERGKELIFERSRYVYNDAIEFFDDNFLSMITSLGLDVALQEVDESETI